MRTKRPTQLLALSALFAGAIAATTAYVLHIPLPTGGYIHVGDALIYLAACLLPMPWAVGAAAIGGALADVLTAPMWAPATLVIKAVVCLPFSSDQQRLLTGRSVLAAAVAGVVSPTLYGLVNVFFARSWAAFLPQFIGTFIQGVGSAAVFFVLALACDRAGLKRRLAQP